MQELNLYLKLYYGLMMINRWMKIRLRISSVGKICGFRRKRTGIVLGRGRFCLRWMGNRNLWKGWQIYLCSIIHLLKDRHIKNRINLHRYKRSLAIVKRLNAWSFTVTALEKIESAKVVVVWTVIILNNTLSSERMQF